MTDHSLMKLGRTVAQTDSRVPEMHIVAPDLMTMALPDEIMRYTEVSSWILGLNDEIGDCTVVGCANFLLAVLTWSTGNIVRIADEVIVTAYEILTGYNPAVPATDTGANEHDVLQYWLTAGLVTPAGVHKIDGYANISTFNLHMIRACIALFGAIYIGVTLPESAKMQEKWDVQFGSPVWGGHCVILVGYRQVAGQFEYCCITWGEPKWMTERFLVSFCDEAYAILTTSAKVPGKDIAFSYVDWPVLENAMDQIRQLPEDHQTGS